MMHSLKTNKIIRFFFSISTLIVIALPLLASAQGGLFADPNSTANNNPYDFSGNSLTTPSSTATGTVTTNLVTCQKNFSDFVDIINYVTCTISRSIIPLLFAIALLIFIYGVIQYTIAGDGSDDREEGRWFMIYGIIGLFVMVSVWGLVALVSNSLDVSTAFPPQFH